MQDSHQAARAARHPFFWPHRTFAHPAGRQTDGMRGVILRW